MYTCDDTKAFVDLVQIEPNISCRRIINGWLLTHNLKLEDIFSVEFQKNKKKALLSKLVKTIKILINHIFKLVNCPENKDIHDNIKTDNENYANIIFSLYQKDINSINDSDSINLDVSSKNSVSRSSSFNNSSQIFFNKPKSIM